MKKLATAFFVLASLAGSAQTLARYGSDSITVSEFLRAYKKNNAGPKNEKALRDYLDLYLNSRLKILEARNLRMDTLPQLLSDLDNLRQQILPSYLTDKEAWARLIDEAEARSKKDIHLAHIFIASSPAGDTAAAAARANDALARLKKGEDFMAVARAVSDDPSAKANGGDLGWITVFSLPYSLENLAYATPTGRNSGIYRSRTGYHIFKNLGERTSRGRVKAAQILIAFPPGATEADKAGAKKLADSVYGRIRKGDDFGRLASHFSNDLVSASANGQIPEFGVGEYEAAFENAVFSLPKDGAVSAPFQTAHGWHIVKRLSLKPGFDREGIRAKVEGNDRMATTKSALVKKMLVPGTYTPMLSDLQGLYLYTDSVFNYKPAGRPLAIDPSTNLFKLGERVVTISDWISYGQTFRYKPDGSGFKAYPVLWDEFVEATAIDYYQNHLEQYNEDFRLQLNEFRDGNLFFEIMQQEVWGPAQTDSAALQQYYESNRAKYTWKPSADAVIFYGSDAVSTNAFYRELRSKPKSWRSVLMAYSEKIAADSARFELSQLPKGSVSLSREMLTPPVTNKSDNTSSFAYIIRTYPAGGQRSFAEARGLVITDYQNELEAKWLAALKRKYPVQVNQAVLNALVKREIGR